MQIISTAAELRQYLSTETSIAFVPTMGNLHEGHLDLVRTARTYGTCVVVSIFVNPLQFGPSEDFDKYPRTLEADCERLKGLADVVFAPPVSEMYPEKQTVFVEPPAIANELEGATRPGHFRGMATVVLKLLNIVQPQVAVFGKKDYQQLHIIRKLVAELNLPVSIVGCETVRDEVGLALSSRNQYLSPSELDEAPFMHQTLQRMGEAILGGEKNLEHLQQQAVEALAARGWKVDYVAVRNQFDLQPPGRTERELVILAAARLGDTRLIDNVEVSLA